MKYIVTLTANVESILDTEPFEAEVRQALAGLASDYGVEAEITALAVQPTAEVPA